MLCNLETKGREREPNPDQVRSVFGVSLHRFIPVGSREWIKFKVYLG